MSPSTLEQSSSTTISRRLPQLEDLLAFATAADAQISPDGEWIAYSVTTTDLDEDGYQSHLWLVASDGSGTPRQLTQGSQRNSAPRWSPDGASLAFLSDRGGKSQLCLLPLAGGEARQLTTLPNGAGVAVWSPDSHSIAFAARVWKEPRPESAAALKRWQHRPKVITRAQYKMDAQGYVFDAQEQIFVVDVKTTVVRLLSDGSTADLAPAWSPDGTQIAFTRLRTAMVDFYTSDIWVMNADGSDVRQVTSAIPRAISCSWSPDGTALACIGEDEEMLGWGDPEQRVWLVPLDGSAPTNLNRAYDRRAHTSRWPVVTPPPVWVDGGRLAFLLSDAGNVQLVTSTLEGDITPLLSGARWITGFSWLPNAGRIAYTVNDFSTTGDVYSCDVTGGNEKQLTHLNEALLAHVEFPEVVRRTFTTPNGEVDGWVMLPKQRNRPVPLLLDIHGGPHSFFGDTINTTYFYRYLLVAQGWAVVMINPTGTGSYGRAFADGIRGAWGERDMPEQMAAVDTLIAEGLADPERLAVTGASYGGYMSAWIITHTDRFKATVIDAPIVNFESFYGTSDIGIWFSEWELKGGWIENRELYRRLSPIQTIENVTTPVLITHGEIDDRCPIGQGEELFSALAVAERVPVEFVRYPHGFHGFIVSGYPSHRLDFNQRATEWLLRYNVPSAS